MRDFLYEWLIEEGAYFLSFFRGGGGLVSYGLVVQRPISTNPRLNFNLDSSCICSKAFLG